MILPWDSRFWLKSQDFTKKHIILTISSLLFLIPCHKLYFYIYHIQCLFLLHNATLAVFFPVGWYKYCVLAYCASSFLQIAILLHQPCNFFANSDWLHLCRLFTSVFFSVSSCLTVTQSVFKSAHSHIFPFLPIDYLYGGQ